MWSRWTAVGCAAILWLLAAAGLHGCAGVTPIQGPQVDPPCKPVSFTYPHQAGQLSFPKDEGRHSLSERPMTVIEWYAF